MKITDHRNSRILFETVEVGEVFMWEGSFWMKTRPCIVCDISCNVVDITNGTFASFEDSDFVEKIEAELFIR